MIKVFNDFSLARRQTLYPIGTFIERVYRRNNIIFQYFTNILLHISIFTVSFFCLESNLVPQAIVILATSENVWSTAQAKKNVGLGFRECLERVSDWTCSQRKRTIALWTLSSQIMMTLFSQHWNPKSREMQKQRIVK